MWFTVDLKKSLKWYWRRQNSRQYIDVSMKEHWSYQQKIREKEEGSGKKDWGTENSILLPLQL